MEILIAEHRGFCFGVRRAEALIEKAAREHGAVATLGSLVHNRQVVERLEGMGVRVVGDLEDATEPAVAISAHGAPPETATQAASRGLSLIDGTCPFVRKAQRAARDLSRDGYAVLIFGDPNHREVKGILGWAGSNAQVIASVDDLPADCPGKKIGIVAQTTQNVENLRRLVQAVSDRWLDEVAEVRVVNTICDASIKRQQVAAELARQVDVMVVIGGRESANTARLTEVCARTGTPTYQVETESDLQADWFRDAKSVGITAGASTPDWVIEGVTRFLQGLP